MSIEAMKKAVAAFDEIIYSCNNIREEKDVQRDAKILARLVRKDCLRAMEDLCQAIAEAEKQPVHAIDISQERVDETAKSKHEPLEQCSYPKCQATNGCVGACSKEQPDLARVGEVGVWGDKREWVGLDGDIPDLGLVTEEFYNGMLCAEDILRKKNT
jgi:hypothetical protein